MSTAETKKTTTAVAKKELSHSERFTQMVMKEHQANAGQGVELTSFQKKLIQNYFVKLDGVLKEAEIKRQAKSEKYRDPLVLEWKNVNMEKLALDVVSFSSIGLDPLQSNHISLIPFKNNHTDKYDIVPMEGYNGIELKAKKYGLEAPDDAIIELVYKFDYFKPIKKDANNKIETYEYAPGENPFKRGEIVGGFYYQIYKDNLEKNKLVFWSVDEIEKRKPAYASAEFWGGEKDNWEYDEKQGKNVKNGKIKVEGWRKEMLWKTLKRACWNDVTIDSEKIDIHYRNILKSEKENALLAVQNDHAENANSETIDIDAEVV